MKKVKVSNLKSDKGNTIPNQFEIETKDGLYFQSYNAIIVFIDKKNSQWYFDEYYWNYSRTTSKYRNVFLGWSTKDCLENIKNGKIKLKNLN